MFTFDEIVKAIEDGKQVSYCGSTVTKEGDYPWSEKSLWINFSNGSAIKAGYREVCSMEIVDEKEDILSDNGTIT